VAYNDLIELSRLCLRQASAARTPAVANELRRMAQEYQARADAMLKEQRPETANGALGRPAPEAVQQQQQPHVEKGSDEAKSSPSKPKRS
jgi:hypothetical protein